MIFIATRADGGEVRYRDSKRYLWIASVLLPLIPILCFALAAVTGQLFWLGLPLLFNYGVIPLLDLLLGEDGRNPPSEVVSQMAEDRYYHRLMYVALTLFVGCLFAGAWAVSNLPVGLGGYLLVTLSPGVMSGTAITVAHELGHAKGRWAHWGAHLANALSWNGHYRLEHNGGHHVTVATPEDSASARFNESFYHFAPREQWGALRRGWQLEARRLQRKRLPLLSRQNHCLQSYALSAALWLACLALFGWQVLPFLALQSYVGLLHLSLANYVEHYGLLRRKRPDGRYEPCAPHHSWNTNHIASNLMLFHLQRHSDHHSQPQKPYQVLSSYERLPSLPSGYPGCFLLTIIPQVWFRVMNPRVLANAEDDWNRVHLAPGAKPANPVAAQS